MPGRLSPPIVMVGSLSGLIVVNGCVIGGIVREAERIAWRVNSRDPRLADIADIRWKTKSAAVEAVRGHLESVP